MPRSNPGASEARRAETDSAQARVLSVVIPMYNEEEVLDPLFQRLLPILRALNLSYEIIAIDDGSTDGTADRLRAWRDRDPCIKVVELARNFGKEAALTAGLELARGLAVVPMDADLQDPPELIAAMLEQWRDGHDVVYGIRRSRNGDGVVKRATARAFYRLFNRVASLHIPFDAGDFRLLDRRVVGAMRRYPERERFMKGLFASVGFKQTALYYDREERAAGTSKWQYWRLWNFALDGLTSFTSTPLRLWSYVGILLAMPAGLYALYLVIRTLAFGVDVPGYTSLAVIMLFFGGVQLLSVGILGEYVGRIFLEAKRRPLYIVKDMYGVENEAVRQVVSGSVAEPPGWIKAREMQ